MDTRRRLRFYVGAWVVAALVVAAVTAMVSRPVPVEPLGSVLWAGAIATTVVHVRARVRGTAEASNFIEAVIVPIMVLLDRSRSCRGLEPAMQQLTAVPSTRATGATLADLHLEALQSRGPSSTTAAGSSSSGPRSGVRGGCPPSSRT